jgi:hypothetical protein
MDAEEADHSFRTKAFQPPIAPPGLIFLCSLTGAFRYPNFCAAK